MAAPHGLSPLTLQTPALVIDARSVDANITAVLRLLEGTGVSWRPHVKTAKLAWTMQRLLDHGLTSFKCATPRELEVLCELGAVDVLVAFPHGGANAHLVSELAVRYPGTRISALVDDARQVAGWAEPVSLFVDLDVGMGRGGIPLSDTASIADAAAAIEAAGLTFRGLHVYDGHLGVLSPQEREAAVVEQLDRVAGLVSGLRADGLEIVTSGTPTFLAAASHSPFAALGVRHAVAPGTVTYADLMTLEKHPDAGFVAAATVVARVVSEWPGRLILDAGVKAVSVDQGIPGCSVSEHPELEPERPSEEHLPVLRTETRDGAVPQLGDLLELVPRHVCTTVANFDEAVLVGAGGGPAIVAVDARGRRGAV